MGSGWVPAAEQLGETAHRAGEHRAARLPAAGRRGPRRHHPLGHGRLQQGAGLPRPHPPLRGPRRRDGGPRRTHCCRRGRQGRGADQRVRRPAPRLLPRSAGAHQRPHQPDRDLADRRCALRRPHRPLLPAAARALSRGGPVAAGRCLRAVPRAALRDAGRDRHGAHHRWRPGRHVDGAGGDRGARGGRGGARHLAGHQPRRGHDRRAAEPRGGPRGRQGRGHPDGIAARTGPGQDCEHLPRASAQRRHRRRCRGGPRLAGRGPRPRHPRRAAGAARRRRQRGHRRPVPRPAGVRDRRAARSDRRRAQPDEPRRRHPRCRGAGLLSHAREAARPSSSATTRGTSPTCSPATRLL